MATIEIRNDDANWDCFGPLPKEITRGIPQELAERRQWVAQRRRYIHTPSNERECVDEYLNPETGDEASVTDPSTWSSLEAAQRFIAEGRATCLIFVLTADDPYTVIYLPETADEAEHLIARFGSFTDYISPIESAIWVRGKLPTRDRNYIYHPTFVYPEGWADNWILLTKSPDFIPVTGSAYGGRLCISDCTRELAAWYSEVEELAVVSPEGLIGAADACGILGLSHQELHQLAESRGLSIRAVNEGGLPLLLDREEVTRILADLSPAR